MIWSNRQQWIRSRCDLRFAQLLHNSFMALVTIAVAVNTLTTMAQPTNQPGLVTSEFIFVSGSVPFAQCHASTLAEIDGNIVAAWFGGTGEGHRDVGIWLSHQDQGHWTAPTEVANGTQADDSRYPCWNPVLFHPRSGPLLLFYKVGPSPSKWWGMLIRSADGGKTWSQPQRLPAGILGPIKNKPVQLETGEILCPTSTEQDGWRVHFERTPDLGQSWTATEPVNDGKAFAAIQPSILIHPGGRLEAVGRTKQGRIFEIWSPDEGRTWGPMTAGTLPNPNSGIDAVTLANRQHVIVYNHTTRGRSPLNLAVSADGHHWKAALILENQPGEYSYPAVIQARNGLVHVTYTWKRLQIKHVVVDPTKLQLRDMTDANWPP
jgi:predicted neuraminidase